MTQGRQELARANNPAYVKAVRYVTKFAMSNKGIRLIRGLMSRKAGYFYYENSDDFGFETVVHPEYHYATFEEAVAHAEMQRERKLRELEKELRRVKKLKWQEPTEVEKAVIRR